MFLISQTAKTSAQIAIGLAVAPLLPLVISWANAPSRPSPDRDQAVATIQQKIADTDDQAEKAYQMREIAILEEHYAQQAHLFRHGFFWLAYPIGVLAFTFGLLGLEDCGAKHRPQLLGPLQRAEEIERQQASLGRSILRGSLWVPWWPLDACALIFALVHRFMPIARGLVFGGLMTVAMGCVVCWDDLSPSHLFLSLMIVFLIFLAMMLRWYWLSEAPESITL